MAQHAELEAQLLAHPDDAQTHLVYADWLTQQGDPRGELIAVQHARVNGDSATLSAAEARLFEAHGKEWLGLLAEHPKATKLEWRLGHVRSMRLLWDSNNPYGGVHVEPALLLRELVSRPVGKLLRRLDHELYASEYDAAAVIAALVESRPPALRELSLADYQFSGDADLNGISWLECGDVSPLYAALPALEELTMMGLVELGERVDLPRLQRLAVRTGALRRAAIEAISRSTLPALGRLELWFGSGNYGAECSVSDLEVILAGAGLPQLRWLGLMNSELADELCALLPRAPILPRLEVLDLSMSVLTNDGARALVENAGAFAHLRELNLDKGYIEGEWRQRLEALGPHVKLGTQREGDVDDDEVHRYVAVGE